MSDSTPVESVGQELVRLGLSPLHIPSQEEKSPKVRVPVGGGLFQVVGMSPDGVVPPGGKRGQVAEFSKASRRRLMRLLASINRLVLVVLPVFVTLTYPGEWPADPERWKRDLETWGRRLARKYPGMSAVWRLEPQKRGAPHYHLLIFGVERVDLGWVARSWFEVVGSGDLRHLAAGTRVERVKSWRGVMGYASKYLAKVGDGGGFDVEHVGRWWGIWGRQNLPVDVLEVLLTFKEFYQLRRLMWRYQKSQGVNVRKGGRAGCWRGLTTFLDWSAGSRLLESLAEVS